MNIHHATNTIAPTLMLAVQEHIWYNGSRQFASTYARTPFHDRPNSKPPALTSPSLSSYLHSQQFVVSHHLSPIPDKRTPHPPSNSPLRPSRGSVQHLCHLLVFNQPFTAHLVQLPDFLLHARQRTCNIMSLFSRRLDLWRLDGW